MILVSHCRQYKVGDSGTQNYSKKRHVSQKKKQKKHTNTVFCHIINQLYTRTTSFYLRAVFSDEPRSASPHWVLLLHLFWNRISGNYYHSTITTTTVLWPFVRDYPGDPVPEETITHSHLSCSSTILYQLPPSTTIHSIIPA